MKIRSNFIYKCYLQRFLSSLPKGEKLNFFFQKYITKSVPQNDEQFIRRLRIAKEHFDDFTKYSVLAKSQDTSCYEFGAGWDLTNSIGLSLLGIGRLYCIDIRELIFPEVLNDTISKLYRLREKAPFDYSIPDKAPLVTFSNFKDILMSYFRIHYKAPADAKCTDFPESSFDLIVSNLTFEHIPKGDIAKVLLECYRILKRDGLVSCLIDYTDHWSHFDSSISKYNFLKYSLSQWNRYNPALHYQNRLRHKDYLDIISKTHFDIVKDEPKLPSTDDINLLGKLEIDRYFLENYTFEELGIKGSRIALKK